MEHERDAADLNFALAAMRLGRITAGQFIEAWQARAGGQGDAAGAAPSLADELVRRGAITAEARREIEREAAASSPTVASPGPASPGPASPTLSGTWGAGDAHVLLHTIDPLDPSRERYTLSRLHSKGGLGQVWLARDTTLGREVAFKEIRPERAENPAVWARFLREARITGALEHPAIVPIYELSRRPETGRPFYTMRFIRGRTLTEAVVAYHAKRLAGEAGALDLQALLSAFIGVANAVAYAHSKGVIHRDLKGDNVIIGDFGEVILLDWGLAKATGEPDDAPGPGARASQGASGGTDSLEAGGTVEGQVLGTPAYMAPEQAAGRQAEIGPLTDVYGLGAILYEILTGRPPVQGDSTVEVLRRVEHEPRVRPRAVRPDTPPALEAICMKAIETRPTDRYPSAGALAEDVRRFLADEPVSAWREPFARRAGRWARRHKPLVASAAVLLLASVIGLSVGTVLLGRKNAEIERQRAQAEENFRLAKGAVDSYLTKVADSAELKAKGLEGLRKELFGSARDFYENFAKQRGGDPAFRSDLGSAQVNLGNISRRTGDAKEAVASYARAIELYASLVRDEPGEVDHTTDLLLTMGNLGLLQFETGQAKEAEDSYRRAIALYEGTSGQAAHDRLLLAAVANVYDNLGTLCNAARRPEDSEAAHKKSMDVRRRLVADYPAEEAYKSELLQSEANLAALYAVTGREGEAIPYLDEAAKIGEALMAAHPGEPDFAKNLAGTLNNLGGVFTLIGRLPEARTAHARALEIREKLAVEHPAVTEYQMYLAGSYVNLGELDVRASNHESAIAMLGKGEGTLSGILEKEPVNETARFYMSYTLSWHARALGALGRQAEAMQVWDRAASFNDRGFPTIPAGHAVALARGGEIPKALAAAAEVEKIPQLPAEVLYDLAATWAIASGKTSGGDRETRAAHAAGLLRQAAALGFFKQPGSLEQIAKDPDFEPIRGRADYVAAIGG